MKVKKGLLLGAAAALAGLAGGVLGTVNNAPVEGAGAATTAQVGSTVTFETDQGFTTSTTYNNMTEKTDGPNDAQWGFLLGTVSTTGAINGSSSAQMRYYTTASTTNGDYNYLEGYLEMKYDVSNVGSVEFYALTSTSLNVTVKESVDQGSTWTDGTLFTLGTSSALYTYNVENSGAEAIRFKFALTAPTDYSGSSGARVVIDDVSFYEPATGAAISLATSSEWISEEAGKTATITATPLNFGDDVQYTWNAATGSEELVSVSGEGATAVVTALEGAEGTATIDVSATDGTNTANATIDIDVLKVRGVKEVLEDSSLLDSKVLLGGYVVTDNTGGSYYTRFQIADADISATYENGETSILLYDSSRSGTELVAKGQYVIIYGDYIIYSGTYEINSGYEVLAAENNIGRLVDFVMGSEAANQCEFKYEIAKAHYLAMTEADKETFQRGTEDDIVAARARYEAWASAIGDTDPYAATSSAIGLFSDSDSVTYALVAATIVLILAVSAVAVYLTLKKRKEQAL